MRDNGELDMYPKEGSVGVSSECRPVSRVRKSRDQMVSSPIAYYNSNEWKTSDSLVRSVGY